MTLIVVHIILSCLLFFLVNWVGEHAADFGYTSITLFEEPKESLALNFLIRALAPAVFMVALSAAVVAAGHDYLRVGIYRISIYYYVLRGIYIFAANMQRLISWPRYFFHSTVGIATAWISYRSLILPNRSLLPDLNAAGNELWLAIFAFLYAAANKVRSSGGPGDRRRNAFIRHRFDNAEKKYGAIIGTKISDDQLKLIAYAILIYEDYCRPPLVRNLERLLFWKASRTTGIMQVAYATPLTDEQSVALGTDRLVASWQTHMGAEPYARTCSTITDYNMDNAYLGRVREVMEILAKRAAPQFRAAYQAIWE